MLVEGLCYIRTGNGSSLAPLRMVPQKSSLSCFLKQIRGSFCLQKPEGWKHTVTTGATQLHCGECVFFSSYQSRGNNEPTPQSKTHSDKLHGGEIYRGWPKSSVTVHVTVTHVQPERAATARRPNETTLSTAGTHVTQIWDHWWVCICNFSKDPKLKQRGKHQIVNQSAGWSCWGSSQVTRGWSAAKTKRSSRFHSGISKPEKACQIKSMVFFNIHMIVH